jgi:hypothetical protein
MANIETILVSNSTGMKKTLLSFDGDSIDIQGKARNVPVEKKFNWNPPRGIYITEPEEQTPQQNLHDPNYQTTNFTDANATVERVSSADQRVAENEGGNVETSEDEAALNADQERRALAVEATPSQTTRSVPYPNTRPSR